MAKRTQGADSDLFTSVDDETYAELAQLADQRVMHVEIWEDSLADELLAGSQDEGAQTFFDLDIYLEEGIYFELYGTSVFTAVDAAPVDDGEELARLLLALVNQQVWLTEVAVDEEDNLVLVLGEHATPHCFVVAGGWTLDEWEELP